MTTKVKDYLHSLLEFMHKGNQIQYCPINIMDLTDSRIQLHKLKKMQTDLEDTFTMITSGQE